MRILNHFRDLLARLLRSWGALGVTLGSIGDYLRVQVRFVLHFGAHWGCSWPSFVDSGRLFVDSFWGSFVKHPPRQHFGRKCVRIA